MFVFRRRRSPIANQLRFGFRTLRGEADLRINPPAGRRELNEMASEAAQKQFGLVARRARELAATH
jgi:hypothetical protein